MRDEMAMTTYVKRFLAAVRELSDRPLGGAPGRRGHGAFVGTAG
jgi:hypothetical protein